MYGKPGLSCHNRVNVCPFKAVELSGYTESISPHVINKKPVPHVQLRNPAAFGDFVNAVAGWTPDNRVVFRFTVVNSL